MVLPCYGSSLRRPVPSSEEHQLSKRLIELLEADTFDLHCYQTPTGTKFFSVVSPGTQGVPAFLKTVYELYADYALKNPFYEVEMPIRCNLFDEHLASAVQRV